MSSDSGNRRGRRLVLVGLLLTLIQLTAKPREQATCLANDSLISAVVCTPIDLLRILGPLARRLVLRESDAPGAPHAGTG